MLSGPKRVFVARPPADMRKGFPGLSALVREHLGGEPTSGDVFVFLNRRADRVKAMWFDGNGYALLYKQLARGRFRLPRGDEEQIEMTAGELTLLLEGADLRVRPRVPKPRPRKRLRYDPKSMRFTVDEAIAV